MQLFRRAWKIQVDTLDVSNLDLEFKILASLRGVPNKCVLTLWNLNQDHRAQLLKRNNPNPDSKKLVGIPVQVEAGYQDNMSVLFSGDLREYGSKLDRLDWKSILSGDDGGRAYREARINASFNAGSSIGAMLTQLCQAMGIGLGNSSDFTAGAQITGMGSTVSHSLTLSGSAAKAMDRLTASLGLTWSIQRGALQLLTRGQPLNLGAIRLAPDTGLLGSPESAVDATVSLGNPQQFAAGAKPKNAKPPKPKDPGILKLKTLLIPGLVPGRKIDLESREFHGGYMITECEYVGKTYDKDWHVNCVARIY